MAARGLMAARLPGVPVLMYHRVAPGGAPVPPADRKYYVAEAVFRAQLDQIGAAGYRTALLREPWSEPRSVVITFDDGRLSDYEAAFPTLQRAGARAEFFVNTANVGRSGYLDWSHMAEMQRAGMAFQSHAHDHVVLLGLSRPALEHQLRASRQMLEDRLARPVDFLAAPYGLLSRAVLETAWEVGYHGVCTSRPWPARPGSRVVTRVAVEADTTPARMAALLAGRPSAYLPGYLAMVAKEMPKRVLLKLRPGALGVRLAGERA